MNKYIQIRNVSEAKHRKLKSRAAASGQTITDFVNEILDRELARPSMAELVERAKRLPQVDIGNTAVEFVRQDRDSR